MLEQEKELKASNVVGVESFVESLEGLNWTLRGMDQKWRPNNGNKNEEMIDREKPWINMSRVPIYHGTTNKYGHLFTSKGLQRASNETVPRNHEEEQPYHVIESLKHKGYSRHKMMC